MKIEKAIEIKLQWRKGNYPPPLADEMNADMLSIEALRDLVKFDEIRGKQDGLLLPGETK